MKLELELDNLFSLLNATKTKVVNSNSRIDNVVIDSRASRISESTLFFAFSGKFEDGADYLQDFKDKGGETAIVSQINERVEINQIQVQDVLVALQSIAKAHRQKFDYPVIGITGSNGKTVVKEWLYVVLKEHFNIIRSPKSYNSQIGVALSLLEMSEDHNLAIIEAGISKPNEMYLLQDMIQPTVGVFTGIGEAHGQNFESQDQKKNEKFKLFKSVDFLIKPKEIPETYSIFNTKAGRSNASLVFQLALYLGLDKESIIQKLNSLPEIAMRMERHQGTNGTLIINDAYSADVNSLDSALSSLQKEQGYDGITVCLSRFKDSLFDENEIADMLRAYRVNRLVYIDKDPGNFDIAEVDYFKCVQEFMDANIEFHNQVLLLKGAHDAGFQEIVDRYIAKNHITRLEIDLNIVRDNLGFFRKSIAHNVRVLAMVKAQAYGGGIIEVGRLLEREGIDYFGVAYANEAVELRTAGISKPIIVMSSEIHGFEDIVQYDLEPSVFSLRQLNDFIKFLIRKNIKSYPIHIKLDTGMNRLGFKQEDLQDLLDLLRTQPEVKVESIFSHLSSADEPSEKEFTLIQIERFDSWSKQIEIELGYPVILHLSNTAATQRYPEAHFDMVRIGIGLFGINDASLRDAIKYVSQISQIKHVLSGESIGYSRKYIAEEDMKIAIIPVGYADGISRALGNGNFTFYVNGIACPTVGNICMDMTMIRLTGDDFAEGDEVELFGDYNKIRDIAQILDTIPYEVLCGISQRVQRIYLQE
ncbi:MAG: alanine racemase [Crocinitomicaceae bacterium]|nr:alanine racemase [Crocinitomicaceae bacterium]